MSLPLIADRKFPTSFCTPPCKDPPAGLGRHAGTETVRVLALPFVRLKRSLHEVTSPPVISCPCRGQTKRVASEETIPHIYTVGLCRGKDKIQLFPHRHKFFLPYPCNPNVNVLLSIPDPGPNRLCITCAQESHRIQSCGRRSEPEVDNPPHFPVITLSAL